MARPTIDHVLGTDLDLTLTILNDATGLAITTYTRGNPLSAKLWRGDDLAPLAAPAIAWNTPTSGTVRLTIARADVAGLEPGTYRLACYVAEPGNVTHCFFYADLKLLAAPGTATTARAYCTYNDMTALYPAVDEVQAEPDESGYLEQRVSARDRVDRLVVERWPGGPAARPAIRAILDAGGLLVTAEAREMAARYALAIVLRRAVVTDPSAIAGGRSSPHQQAGAAFEAEADAMAARWVAEVDADGDGAVDAYVDCRYAPPGRNTTGATSGMIGGPRAAVRPPWVPPWRRTPWGR